ncbi:hypothetical protein [Solibacillus sp. R5-41]|nr:hypothetical protein [Solibacillus sp. R5-41]
MMTFLKSMFATYLLDEEHDVEVVEQTETQAVEQYEQYPAGFFSSL